MTRIKRLVRPEAEALNWKLALPILGLAVSAACYSWAAPAHAAAEPQAKAATEVQADRVVTRHKNVSVTTDSREHPYAIVRSNDKGTSMSGSSEDWDEIKEAKGRIGGDFLWFRESGQAWYIQDAGVMAKVDAAWAPVTKLGKQMDAYGKEMDVHGKRMDALGKEMDVAARGMKVDDSQTRAAEARMKELGKQMDALGKQFAGANDAERERLSRQMSELGNQMSTEGQRMGQEWQQPAVRQAQQSMDEIGRRMGDAGKPMDALGKKMGALGKEMERETHAADKTVRALIQDARAKGLAKPVPRA